MQACKLLWLLVDAAAAPALLAHSSPIIPSLPPNPQAPPELRTSRASIQMDTDAERVAPGLSPTNVGLGSAISLVYGSSGAAARGGGKGAAPALRPGMMQRDVVAAAAPLQSTRVLELKCVLRCDLPLSLLLRPVLLLHTPAQRRRQAPLTHPSSSSAARRRPSLARLQGPAAGPDTRV